MRLVLIAAFTLAAVSARAQTLEDTKAFDRAFAASFYTFDACGDGKHGLLFRKALAARFAECPFSPAAVAAHRKRLAYQAQKSHDIMEKMIEDNGGLPVRLPGMEETCRQQRAEPDYATVRARLESYATGALKPEDVLAAPCDAEAIAP